MGAAGVWYVDGFNLKDAMLSGLWGVSPFQGPLRDLLAESIAAGQLGCACGYKVSRGR